MSFLTPLVPFLTATRCEGIQSHELRLYSQHTWHWAHYGPSQESAIQNPQFVSWLTLPEDVRANILQHLLGPRDEVRYKKRLTDSSGIPFVDIDTEWRRPCHAIRGACRQVKHDWDKCFFSSKSFALPFGADADLHAILMGSENCALVKNVIVDGKTSPDGKQWSFISYVPRYIMYFPNIETITWWGNRSMSDHFLPSQLTFGFTECHTGQQGRRCTLLHLARVLGKCKKPPDVNGVPPCEHVGTYRLRSSGKQSWIWQVRFHYFPGDFGEQGKDGHYETFLMTVDAMTPELEKDGKAIVSNNELAKISGVYNEYHYGHLFFDLIEPSTDGSNSIASNPQHCRKNGHRLGKIRDDCIDEIKHD